MTSTVIAPLAEPSQDGYSYSDATGDGVTVSFMFEFSGPVPGYLSHDEIYVYLRDDDVDSANYGGYTLVTGEYQFPSPQTVQLPFAPEAPKDGIANIRVRRIMDKDELYANVNSDDIFRKEILTKTFLQQLYALQEVLDGYQGGQGGFTSDLNMNSNNIYNLADGTEEHHAVTLRQLDEIWTYIRDAYPDMYDEIQRMRDEVYIMHKDVVERSNNFADMYLGEQTTFPDNYHVMGAMLSYVGADAAPGLYVREEAFSDNNGWRPSFSDYEGTEAGVTHVDITTSTTTDRFPLGRTCLAVDVAIHGVQQGRKTYNLINDNSIVVLDQFWPSGTELQATVYYAVQFAVGTTFKGSDTADNIVAIADALPGDAWFVTEDGTIEGDNEDWKAGDSAVFTDSGTWAIGALVGPAGAAGTDGEDGLDGVDGASAYEVWMDEGNTGTEADFLAALKGKEGDSAYEVAVASGFVGDEDEWLASLGGTDGVDGRSAYQVAVDNGYEGTVQQWLVSLEGSDGAPGADGADGKAGAGFVFKGRDALDSILAKSPDTANDLWLTDTQGIHQGYTVNIGDGLSSDGAQWNYVGPFKGEKGERGAAGLSPYVHSTSGEWFSDQDNNGTYDNTGVLARGPQGEKGDAGSDGADGVGVSSVAIQGTDLVINYTDSTQENAGRVVGFDGADGTDGVDGKSIPLQVQYSPSDSGDNWVGNPPNITERMRFSVDGGVTWSAATTTRGSKGLRGDQGVQGPQGVAGGLATIAVQEYQGSGEYTFTEDLASLQVPAGSAPDPDQVLVFFNSVPMPPVAVSVTGSTVTIDRPAGTPVFTESDIFTIVSTAAAS